MPLLDGEIEFYDKEYWSKINYDNPANINDFAIVQEGEGEKVFLGRRTDLSPKDRRNLKVVREMRSGPWTKTEYNIKPLKPLVRSRTDRCEKEEVFVEMNDTHIWPTNDKEVK